ncbi:DpnD/PcfM family protein [Campylobacter showae]|uniref:DpnD/PcfM family protein n=1 Tax=Campylobacter showae TaxID=204 RepID=UPI000F078215|nr:DpnD/PcfM family protein [Campylobacter showae]
MKEFEVEIVETSARRVVIKAKNKEEACKIVRAAYENCEIVLSAENFVCADFKATIADEPKTEI